MFDFAQGRENNEYALASIEDATKEQKLKTACYYRPSSSALLLLLREVESLLSSSSRLQGRFMWAINISDEEPTRICPNKSALRFS